ncbi:MAG: hypothetical protein HYT80_08110 [Euryarchaeota archaeon]|nr:hypothetical protein [Euryarchaeota archaeon]
MRATTNLGWATAIGTLLVALTPGAAAEEGPSTYCTTTDYDFDDPGYATGPYRAQSGSPVPSWLYVALVVNEWTPAGYVWVTVRVIVDVASCFPG